MTQEKRYNEANRATEPMGNRPIGLRGLIRLIRLIRPIYLNNVLAATLFLAAACSPDSDSDSAVKRISFGSSMQPPTTIQRSVGLEDYHTDFKVWGYKNMSESAGSYDDLMTVLNGYKVAWTALSAGTTTSNSADWEYVGTLSGQTIKYWDYGAKAYRFFGCAAYGADGTTIASSCTAPEATLTIDADATDDDKITATPYYSALKLINDKAQYGGQVRMDFKKPFARVRFIFAYTHPEAGFILKNKSFKPSDGTTKIPRKGKVIIGYPLTGTGTEETFKGTSDIVPASSLTDFTEDYTDDNEKWYTVLPATSQQSYTLSVKVNNVDKTAVVPEQYMRWLPNYEYTYIFKITDEGGVEIDMVIASFTDWNEISTNYAVHNW